MSQYERGQRGNALSGDGPRLPSGGNTSAWAKGLRTLGGLRGCLGGRLDSLIKPASTQMTMQLLFSNHVYDDLGLRIGGVFLFAIGLIVAGMIIREESRAYAVTLFVRAFIITALLTLYTQYGDPALLATSTVVTIGWILTFLGWRKDTAEQRG